MRLFSFVKPPLKPDTPREEGGEEEKQEGQEVGEKTDEEGQIAETGSKEKEEKEKEKGGGRGWRRREMNQRQGRVDGRTTELSGSSHVEDSRFGCGTDLLHHKATSKFYAKLSMRSLKTIDKIC
eukprot:767585-Hanusia_phi.AAC.2